MAVVRKDMDAGMADDMIGDFTGSREEGCSNDFLLLSVKTVVKPVIAPREGARHAKGGLVVIGTGGRAEHIPFGDCQQPFLRALDQFLVLEQTTSNGEVPDGIDNFLAVDVHLSPKGCDTLVVGIGRRFSHDWAVYPRLDRAFVEILKVTMIRVFLQGHRES